MSSVISDDIVYPDSDGQPMAENTLQFEWIVTIKGNLEAQFRADPNVLVVGDLLWYPVEGHPEIRQAPDVMTIFGRPKGYRGSYRQWEEAGVAPQVVWEILSPGNRSGEMARKFEFYQRHGVEEYYIFDPERLTLQGYQRQADRLVAIAEMAGWMSPRLGIRFELGDTDLVLRHPDGSRFLTFVENRVLQEQSEQERRQAETARRRAETNARKAETERQRAETERLQALAERQQAEASRQRAEAERQQEKARAERLRAQLQALGIEPVE